MEEIHNQFDRRQFLSGVGKVGIGLGLMGGLGPLLEACSSGSSSSPKVNSQGLAKGAPFVFGSVQPITGLDSVISALTNNGVLAQNEINAKGGILGHRVITNRQNDQDETSLESAVMSKFQSDGVNYVFGPWGSSQAEACLTVTTPNKMIQAAWADADRLGNASVYPYFYQPAFTTRQEAEIGTTYLIKNLGITKLGCLYSDTAFGTSAHAVTVETAQKLGARVVGAQAFSNSTTDMTVYVDNVRQAGAEGLLVFTGEVPPEVLIFKAMDQFHYYPPVAGHTTNVVAALVPLIPPQQVNHVYGICYKNLTYTKSEPIKPRQIAYADKLRSKSASVKTLGPLGVEMSPMYDWLYILKQAIETAGSFDTDKVRDALNHITNYDGMIATMSFTAANHSGIPDEQLCLAITGSLTSSQSQGGAFAKRAE